MEADFRGQDRMEKGGGRDAAGRGVALFLFLLVLGFGAGLALGSLAQPGIEDRLPRVGDASKVVLGLSGLPKARPPGERRVFVLGASLTFGLPYEPVGIASFATLCERGLRAVFEGARIRVRAMAHPAVDATELASQVPLLLEWRPTTLILILGANEFLRRAVSGRALEPEAPLERAARFLAGNRGTFEVMARRIDRGGGEGGLRGGFRARIRSAGPGRPGLPGLPVGPRDRRLLVERCRRALRGLAAACEAAGTDLVLALSVQGFEGCPPWLSDLEAGPAALDRFVASQLKTSSVAALPRALALASAHPERADLRFVLALLQRKAGAAEEARASWGRALDLDLVPLHRTGDLVRALEEEAGALSVPLLRLDEALAGADGLPESERFLDYAHVDLEGQARIARYLAEALAGRAWPVLPPGWREGFDRAVRDWLEARIDPKSRRLARARLAKNNGGWLMLFGNFRDALPFLEEAFSVLKEPEIGEDLAFCRRRLREAGLELGGPR